MSTIGAVIVFVSNRALEIKRHVVITDADFGRDKFPTFAAQGAELIDRLPSFDEFVFPLLRVNLLEFENNYWYRTVRASERVS